MTELYQKPYWDLGPVTLGHDSRQVKRIQTAPTPMARFIASGGEEASSRGPYDPFRATLDKRRQLWCIRYNRNSAAIAACAQRPNDCLLKGMANQMEPDLSALEASDLDVNKIFPETYLQARTQFRETVTAAGWELEVHPIEAVGPDGEELTIDVACSTTRSCESAVLVSSGLHGAEGYMGSAMQVGWLRASAGHVDLENTKVVFLHGLNPYGFAWLRRVDEVNVDLNRNFLLPGESYSGAPEIYTQLDGLLNPQTPASVYDLFVVKALGLLARYGMTALKQAIASGQHDFPKGLFFAGERPSKLHFFLSQNMPRWLDHCQQVMQLDFHSGLGRNGDCKLLLDYPLVDWQRARLEEVFGCGTFDEIGTMGIAYDAKGGLGRWCVAQAWVPRFLFTCAEFGTYPPLKVLAGLRQENRAHHWGKPNDKHTIHSKRRLKELFCPASTHWRRKVLRHGIELIDHAVSASRTGESRKMD